MLIDICINSGLSILDPGFDTPEARVMLIAIGMQESKFSHRTQISGPARGFWQFEKGGIRGVLNHPSTKQIITNVCNTLRIPPTEETCYSAVAYNDTLACVFARLLLWTLPNELPRQGDPDEGWRQYIMAWRPGKPHRETWDNHYNGAWLKVAGGS
jgi:hypothetical protein